MLINQKGGKVINSGGFGCIFNPSLKCENDNINKLNDSSHNKISKLMITKYAKYEFNQIEKYNTLLNIIPNYNNYFLLNNFKLCKPDKLTTNDLKGYNKKCKNIKKAIKGKNINETLNDIMIINMPNGGINIEQYINKYFSIKSNIIKLNNSLIDLLLNGIIPMNKLNVYHCDIKEGNVLVQNEPIFVTRLIDWGLSFIWNNNYKGIPAKLYRRPFQFNVPFSSILFNKDFIKLYNNFLDINPNPTYFNIREFVINYIFIWNNIRGSGHLNIINNIIKKFTINELTSINYDDIKDQLIEYDFTHYYIVEYLSKILEKFTNNKKLDLLLYFKNVFLKNIDIWGFTMIYIEFYNNLYNTFNTINEYQMNFIERIKYIIIHFLYESPINPIDVSSLIDELTNLNKYIDKFDLSHSSKKIEYISKLKDNVNRFLKNKLTKKKRRKYEEKTKKITRKQTKKIIKT
jgi:hypothetical protein